MTYPASELDGRMVTGMMTPTMDEHATYPPSLRSELTERVPGYRIGLKWSEYRDRQEEFLEALDDLVDARRRVMEWFMETEDWRLFFFVYTAPDRLQHLIWDEETLLEHYRHLDDVLGEVMEYVADRDSLLFVVSDHGFGPLSRFVHVNALLEDAGYLRREDTGGARGLLERTGISRDDVKGLLRRLHVTDELLVKYLPRPLVDRVAENIPGTHSLYDVDHSRTKAFVAGIGGVYINDTDRFESGVVEPESVPSFKRELRRFLSDVTDPETGEPALEVFDGPEPTPSDASVPDLVVKGLEGYEVSVSLGNTTFAPAAGRMAAGHRSDGILLAWGSEVAAGVPLSGATVVDVAPTLLHGLGEPVGEAMDGRVLRELFRRDSDPARRSVRTRAYEQRAEGPSDEASASEGDVEERLRGLGYIE
jgi:predicted AlkP superfamily phosphohydrolase/phosphomutase